MSRTALNAHWPCEPRGESERLNVAVRASRGGGAPSRLAWAFRFEDGARNGLHEPLEELTLICSYVQLSGRCPMSMSDGLVRESSDEAVGGAPKRVRVRLERGLRDHGDRVRQRKIVQARARSAAEKGEKGEPRKIKFTDLLALNGHEKSRETLRDVQLESKARAPRGRGAR